MALPQVFSIAPSNIGPAGKTSPAGTLPANAEGIAAAIVCATWFSKSGSLYWRLELFVGGAWVPAIDNTLAIGSSFRNNGTVPPSIGYTGDLLPNATQVRIFVQPSVTLNIGADVTIAIAG